MKAVSRFRCKRNVERYLRF